MTGMMQIETVNIQVGGNEGLKTRKYMLKQEKGKHWGVAWNLLGMDLEFLGKLQM